MDPRSTRFCQFGLLQDCGAASAGGGGLRETVSVVRGRRGRDSTRVKEEKKKGAGAGSRWEKSRLHAGRRTGLPLAICSSFGHD